MAVQDELEAILARLQRMREELRLEVAAGEASRERAAADGREVAQEDGTAAGEPARHDKA